jgi:diguanylate cyclase (GGDEF)-like protein
VATVSSASVATASSAPTVEEVAAAAGATDLFLFRRVEQQSFAHIGGVGRGAGWAGILEIGLAEESVFAEALERGGVVRHDRPDLWHVFGPYYGRSVAIVPVSPDVVAVFGAPEAPLLELEEAEFAELALWASESIGEVAASKRLADELEVVNAVRDLLRLPAGSFEETLHGVVEHARLVLSCDLGVLAVREPAHLAVSDPAGVLRVDPAVLARVMNTIAESVASPFCVQDACTLELPAPFSRADGVLAYYVLGFSRPVPGTLLLAHTDAGPRGFTQLCQSLGLRLVDAAGVLFETALARDELRDELARSSSEARRDTLTGLANRLAWDEATARFARGQPASVLMIDCRGLKHANETYGHDVGDRLLRRVADVVAGSVRTGDLVARLGGDEFAVLLPEADEGGTRVLCERIHAALEAEPPIESVPAAVAIGAATTDVGDLMAAQKLADARLREAKRPPGSA